MASSLSLPNHTLASLLPSHTPKTQSSVFQCVPILSKSSQSQFYGLNFSYSSSSFKTSISAKVNKGSVPPSFTLKDQDGKNACAFRDSCQKFKKARAEVVGISGDDPSSHKAFANKYRLPFTLLCDEGNKVRKDRKSGEQICLEHCLGDRPMLLTRKGWCNSSTTT
ncbi:hypothetical protein CRYUN_Cryun03dG0021700 [Craigia yunnanensis]